MNEAEKIIEYIKNAKKKTPVKAYIKGNLPNVEYVRMFDLGTTKLLIGDIQEVQRYVEENSEQIEDIYLENDRRNSAIDLLNTTNMNARIEPGSIIREGVTIKDYAVIMMGAVINIGAVVGKNSMIDMNAVLGGRAIVGDNCHIGAGTVLAGVIEPASATPVVIEDNVLIGANAVVLEGVHVGENAVIGAGSVVTKDVPANAVVVGNPGKVIKMKDEQTSQKTKLEKDLRTL